MPTIISITTSKEYQAKAAHYLSEYLSKLGCPHAYIGGFAWSLLGSSRPTEIIYISFLHILIKTDGQLNVGALRGHLSELDKHFASAGIKFYFVQELIDNLRDDALVRANKNNVLIEILQAGSLGLPQNPEPVYVVGNESGLRIQILHPSILILTKLKRWSQTYESTRPKTIAKNSSDKNDIDFLIQWMAEHEMKIRFELYQGKTKEDLLDFVKKYQNRFLDNVDLMDSLRKVVDPKDWDLLQSE